MDIYKENGYQFNLSASVPVFKLVNLRQLVFEVTTYCNLNCTYCGYGSLYNMRTHKERTQMPFSMAKIMIDYLFDLWVTHDNDYDIRETFIGFYGGEPLLNFKFIESVVSYIEEHPVKKRRFGYTMTTNAMLLDKYMDFLVEKKINLVISLDGNKMAHSYRVDWNGQNSFDRVIGNIKELQSKYPAYFDKYVAFNSVLTNRGDLLGIKKFVLKEFGKNPMVAEVNDFGIQEAQRDKFNKIYKSVRRELSQKTSKELFDKIDFAKNPTNRVAFLILKSLSGNSFSSYNSLLPQKEGRVFPTGTCFPFDKKLFVTVKGELLPCERINQRFSLGHIAEDRVHIDFEYIAKKYSDYYKRIYNHCKECYAKPICEQCMFYVSGIDDNPSCPNFLNKQQYEELIASHLNYLAENPHIYQRMMEEMF